METAFDKSQICVLVCDQTKDTALHYAAKFGQLEAVIYLVEDASAHMNKSNDVRIRLLHYSSTDVTVVVVGF